jgi:hypothetical protein
MKEEPKQNPIITIAVAHFIVVILILKYIQEFAIGQFLPQMISGATPVFPLFMKFLITLGFILDFPLSFVASQLNLLLYGFWFYLAEALNSLLWGWVIVSLYRKFKRN